MDITVTRHYDHAFGPFAKTQVEVLNDRYGRITTRRWRSEHQYAIELATLAPEPEQITHIAWQWLIAALVSLAGLVAFVAVLQSGNVELPMSEIIAVSGLLLLLTLVFFYLFGLLSTRRLVFKAKFSGTPLVDIPLPMRARAKGKAFAAELGQLAQKNRARLHHSDDDMRAGELRMLRRLSEEGAIDDAAYDKAKLLLLRLAS